MFSRLSGKPAPMTTLIYNTLIKVFKEHLPFWFKLRIVKDSSNNTTSMIGWVRPCGSHYHCQLWSDFGNLIGTVHYKRQVSHSLVCKNTNTRKLCRIGNEVLFELFFQSISILKGILNAIVEWFRNWALSFHERPGQNISRLVWNSLLWLVRLPFAISSEYITEINLL